MRRSFCTGGIVQEGVGWHSSSRTASGQCSCKEFHACLCPGAELCVDVHHIYCVCDLQSACTCVETCQTEHLKDVHRCPRVRPAGSPFGFCFMSIFCLWYFMIEKYWGKIMQFVSWGFDVWNQAHISKTQTIQSDEVWPSLLHFQMCSNASFIILWRMSTFNQRQHRGSGFDSISGLYCGVCMFASWLWDSLGFSSIGRAKDPPPQLGISSDKQKMPVVSLHLEKSWTKPVFASLDVNATQTLHTNINPDGVFQGGMKGSELCRQNTNCAAFPKYLSLSPHLLRDARACLSITPKSAGMDWVQDPDSEHWCKHTWLDNICQMEAEHSGISGADVYTSVRY